MSWLRIGAILAFIQGLAHGAMFVTAQPRHGAQEVMVVETMKRHAFDFGGATHSYWDMYFGYGLLAAGTCLVEAALLWLMAGPAGREPARFRAMVAVLIAANLGHAAIILRYFFYLPLVADLLVAGCLAIWLATARISAGRSCPD